MIPYDRVLQLWGVSKLQTWHPDIAFIPSTVTVEMNFNEGVYCCDGSDPLCYCSFAESRSSDVRVTGQAEKRMPKITDTGYVPSGDTYTWTESAEDFDFATMVKELFAIAVAAEES